MLAKLLSIQMELKAPKAQYNDFGKYAYRSAEDILNAVKPLLAKNNLVLTISDDLVFIGDRYYVKAIVTLTETNKSDSAARQQIVTTAFAREELTKKGMDGSQITGAASSYARKYALNGMFAIDDVKDADGTNEHDDKTPYLINNTQMAIIKNTYKDVLPKLLEAKKLKTLEEMSYKVAKEIIDELKEIEKNKNNNT